MAVSGNRTKITVKSYSSLVEAVASTSRGCPQNQKPFWELHIENLPDLLNACHDNELLKNLLKQCSDRLLQLHLESNTAMTEANQVKMESLAELLSSLGNARMLPLKTLHLKCLRLVGSFQALSTSLMSLRQLKTFDSSTCHFRPDHQSNDRTSLRSFVITLASLPELQEVDLDFQIPDFPDVQKVKLATLLLKSKTLSKLCLWNLPTVTEENPSHQSISIQSAYDGFFERLRFSVSSSLQTIKFYGTPFNLQQAKQMAETIQEPSNLVEVAISLQEGAYLSPIIESLNYNTTLHTIGLYIPKNTGAVSIPEDSWKSLLTTLETSNTTLKQMRIACGRFSHIDDLLTTKARDMKVKIDFYLKLNRDYQRERILKDPHFTNQDLLQLLPGVSLQQDHPAPGRLAVLYYLLSAKPDLWSSS